MRRVGEALGLRHRSSPATPGAAVPAVCQERGLGGEQATPGAPR